MAQYYLQIGEDTDLEQFSIACYGTGLATPVVELYGERWGLKLQRADTTTARVVLLWDLVPDAANVDVLIEYHMSATYTNRYTGSICSSNRSQSDSFLHGQRSGSMARPQRRVNGTLTSLAADYAANHPSQTLNWVWSRIRRQDGVLFMVGGGSADACFEDWEYTNGGYTGSLTGNRPVGFQTEHTSSADNRTYLATIAVGTDGDPAPTGPIAPPIWTPSMFAAVALAADVSVAVTLSRPVATISAGAWLPLSGTDLHAMINSETPDLDTHIYATEPTITRMELGNVSLPALAARALQYYAGGTNGGLKVRLYEGASLIAERTHATLPSTPTQYAMTLTEGELTALTDGTDLFVELESIA